MGVLPDWMIEQLRPVEPFEPAAKRPGKISYGLTSYGYDARVGYKFKVFTPAHCGEVDPKDFDERSFVEFDLTPHDGRHEPGERSTACKHCGMQRTGWLYAAECVKRPQPSTFVRIPPNSFCLAESVETFSIPRDCHGLVVGKSTYARCGIIVTMTPLEPEWRGKVTVEISNTAPLPARVYAGEGIMQVLFLQTAGYRGVDPDIPKDVQMQRASCRVSYADKGGKYQDQAGIVLPKVD